MRAGKATRSGATTACTSAFAVAIEDGLVTPVVRDADQKGIGAIAAEVKDPRRAREESAASRGTRSPARRSRCRTLGMLGMRGSPRSSTRPEAGILAIGATVDEPVVVKDQVRGPASG